MAGTMAKVRNTSVLLRSLCSLMPISITLVSCSSAFTLPSAARASAGGSTSASPGGRGAQAGQRSPPSGGSGLGSDHRASPALSTRGGTEEERSSQGGCGVDKHSFRSTGHPAVPDGLRLKQVVVICRHGDRAPVTNSLGTILNDDPESVSLWESKLPPTEDVERWNKAFPCRVLGNDCGQTIEEIISADGPWGQLTSRGADELRAVGEGLRTVLEGGDVAGGGGERLFPGGLEAEASSVFVRCTKLKRTQQSAQNLLMGLGLSSGVDLFVRPHDRETLWPSERNRVRQYELIAQATENNEYPEQAELKRQTAEMVGVEEDGVKWTTVREVLTCYEAHGVPLPRWAVDSGVVKRVVDYTGWIWGRWFNTREMARLSIGPFLAELLTIIGATGDEKGVPEAGMASTPKLAIFSGHDTTLVPIMTALKIYDDVWPRYASYISLDIASDEQGARLVRVVFNGKETVLPGAAGPWIPLQELQQRLEDIMPTTEDAVVRESDEQSSKASSEISAAISRGEGSGD